MYGSFGFAWGFYGFDYRGCPVWCCAVTVVSLFILPLFPSGSMWGSSCHMRFLVLESKFLAMPLIYILFYCSDLGMSDVLPVPKKIRVYGCDCFQNLFLIRCILFCYFWATHIMTNALQNELANGFNMNLVMHLLSLWWGSIEDWCELIVVFYILLLSHVEISLSMCFLGAYWVVLENYIDLVLQGSNYR